MWIPQGFQPLAGGQRSATTEHELILFAIIMAGRDGYTGFAELILPAFLRNIELAAEYSFGHVDATAIACGGVSFLG